MEKIPVTVLTGYLGAGKTTLLNRILSEPHGKKYAVIVNEYGEEGIDGALVVGSDEEIFEMNNGCICCTVRGDLIRIISGLMKRAAGFDGILIETTGLADPAPVAQTFFADEDIAAKARLDSIVTVVDAYHIKSQLGAVAPASFRERNIQSGSERSAEPLRPNKEAHEQIAFADIILLNKTDLVGEQELVDIEAAIQSINRFAKIIRTVKGQVPLNQILGLGTFDLEQILRQAPDFLKGEAEQAHVHDEHCGHDHSHDHGHAHDEHCHHPASPAGFAGQGHAHEHNHIADSDISSLSLTADQPLDAVKFESWMGDLRTHKGQDLLRYKGILDIAGSDRRLVVQGVHMMMDGGNLDAWKDGETRSSRLVFIGRHLDKEALRAGFAKCAA